jgi:hypothetical protein
MGDFFHNAFLDRGLGSFWFLKNWVRFVKLQRSVWSGRAVWAVWAS